MMAMPTQMQCQGAQYVFVVPASYFPSMQQPTQQAQPQTFQFQQPQMQQHMQPQMMQPQMMQQMQQQMQPQPQPQMLQLPNLQLECDMKRQTSHCSTASGSNSGASSPSGASDRPDAMGVLGSRVQVPLAGNVLQLSRISDGCRLVQDALDAAATDEERTSIAHELRGSVAASAKHMSANHVLQKVIVTTNPQSLQFIVDELCALGEGVAKVAKHKYGCRIFQRLLENCRPAQLVGLAELILADWLKLATHLYGTYVIQSLLEHGTVDQQRRLAAEMALLPGRLGADVHGSAALGAALCHVEPRDRVLIASSLVHELGHDGLADMARSRRGYSAVIAAMDALAGQPGGAEVARRLAADASLRSMRYGKLVVNHLRGRK